MTIPDNPVQAPVAPVTPETAAAPDTPVAPAALAELVRLTRTHRRFREEVPVSRDDLLALVDLARLAATATNLQPLKYILSWEPERNALIFPHLVWARRLKGWAGPAPGQRPAAYIIVLGDTTIAQSFGVDHGIASQNIMLGATARGLMGCMIASVAREPLRAAMQIPERYEILLVLAFGAPGETVVIDPMPPDGNTAYWRDAGDFHHVPKRALEEIVIG
jgi:nitroreductase